MTDSTQPQQAGTESADRSFFAFTADRPVAILMVVLAALVFGAVGLFRLPVNLLPDISYPTVTIRTTYDGASPVDVEERVSERIQDAVSVISGVRHVYSVSRPGVSDVILEFDWGTQMAFATSDVRERLDRIQLPSDAERPLVLRYDPSLDPIMTVGVVAGHDRESLRAMLRPGTRPGRVNEIELRRIAEEEIERELSELDGVAAVKVRGGDEEEVRIALDENALSLYGLDVSTIGERLRQENLNAAAGSIEESRTEYLVRAMGEFRTVQEVGAVVLERRGDVSIRLSDVARIERVPADKTVVSRIDGKVCVLVDIYKEAGANIVQLCEQVRSALLGDEEQRAYVLAGRHLEALPPKVEPKKKKTTDGTAKKNEGKAVEAGSKRGKGKEKRKPDPAKMKRLRKVRERAQKTDFLAFTVAPSGVALDVLQDQSRFIQQSVDDVLSSALLGGFFAIAVIYLFLRRLTATTILAVSIPVSLVATFAPMFVQDIDLNIMSLGGLALGVGMLVDNSIVVLESIARAREQGNDRRAAGILGVSRVASAVVASTLTTVAVFFPIVFVEGVAGQLFRDQALTVVFALMMSLFAALFLIPMLATRGGDPSAGTRAVELVTPFPQFKPSMAGARVLLVPFVALLWVLRVVFWGLRTVITALVVGGIWLVTRVGYLLVKLIEILVWPFSFAFDRLYRAVDKIYPTAVASALRARFAVVLVAIGLLAWTVSRIPNLGSEMLPEVHQGEIYVEAFLPRDATVERTDGVMRGIEQRVGALPDVADTFLACGIDPEELNDSDQGEHSAKLLVRMAPTRDRLGQEERVRGAIRKVMRGEPSIQSFRFSRPSVLEFSAPLVVEVLGRDLVDLRRACTEVESALAAVPGLRDVRSTLQRGNPEIAIRLDRDQLAAYNIEPQQVTRILQAKVQGDVPTRFAERERKLDIRLRIDREEIATVGRLLAINVNPAGNPAIPLEAVAKIRRSEGPSEIRRIGNLRGAEVRAAVAGFDIGSTQERVLLTLDALELPDNIEVRLGGQKEEMEQSLQSLTMALLLAIFLVYIVMASQFESLVQPLVILVSLPLALVGVVITLEVLAVPLSVIVFLGAIVLAGIVVNNAIILIDQINRLRAQGMPKLEAIQQGAHTRLRPVLMTTMTTVLGLLPLTGWLAGVPLLGGSDEGVELRAPMAITVVAGLMTSTILTLLVVPCVYSLSDRKS